MSIIIFFRDDDYSGYADPFSIILIKSWVCTVIELENWCYEYN